MPISIELSSYGGMMRNSDVLSGGLSGVFKPGVPNANAVTSSRTLAQIILR